ncbi:MAG: glycosyltransferase family 4 protein [Chloroflexi bacterium]|nr:glycosyltransferase family 4 protein [Chloroflexota bacterium]
MRLAVFSTARVPSRTANSIQVLKVCQALLDLGHEVRLWLPGPAPQADWPELARQYGVRGPMDITWCRAWPLLRRYDYALTSMLQARRWRADLIYAWPLQTAALAARLGLPVVLELHELPTGKFGPGLLRAFLRGRGPRRLLPITAALRDLAAAAYALPTQPGSVQVAPMGVDLERYQDLPAPAEARRRLGWPQDFTIGYTGHLYAGRGIELLVEVAVRLPGARFVVIGGEPQAVQTWQVRAREAGAANVHFLGFMANADLPVCQAACEVLVMPSQRSIAGSSGGDIGQVASPMKTFEYLATGRAIVASDLPVFREVLNSGNAVLLPPDHAAAWVQALENLQQDTVRREQLGRQARLDAGQYSWVERERRSLDGLDRGGPHGR